MIFRDFWMRPKVRALDNVDLQVNRGEIYGLLGPNGSGKSTLMKILLGLLFPTTGRAAIFGRDPRNLQVKDRIGYMPEESYLYRYLNAEETLDFYGRLFGLPRGERRHRVQLLLEMVGLERQSKRPIVEYSKGMARRIGLAQALINDPDLVFLDEPTTGLDPIGTREIKDLIVELRNRGKTVFLCSHLLADVEDVCDRVAILYGGKVRRMGSMDELLEIKAQTQILTPQLRPETIAKVVDTIQEMEGAHKTVDVSTPRDRLESYFLRVVEEARAAHIETAGVTVGAGAESFFEGIKRDEKADNLLATLLAKSEELKVDDGDIPAVPLPEVKPASEPVSKQTENILDGLVKSKEDDKAEEEKVEEKPKVVSASEPDTPERTTDDVLNSLLGGGTQTDAAENDSDKAE
jgi:ABC-2 type transport system ATP-binding protein